MDASNAHVIDSDSKVEEYIPQLQERSEAEEKPFVFQSFVGNSETGEIELSEPGEFEDGLSVIHIDDVREEERVKISEEMLTEAHAEADQIIEEARAEAERMILEAQSQIEVITEEAQRQGFDAGVNQGLAEGQRQLEEQMRLFQEDMEESRKAFQMERDSMEPYFAGLVADLVEKIVGVSCSECTDVILHLIQRSVAGLGQPEQIIIRVSREDMPTVTGSKTKLQELVPETQKFDIVEDASLQSNQCIIETDNQIIDCSLDVQLDSLRNKLKMLSI